MAALTAEQNLIIALVGDLDPVTGDVPITPDDGIVAQNIEALWERHENKAALSPALRAAYVQRDAINLVLTILAPEVDTTPPMGGSVRLQQRVATYQARLAAAQAELQRLESTPGIPGGLVAIGVPVVGLIARQTPYGPPPYGTPDPNAQVYGGSPVRRRADPNWWTGP